MAEAQFRFYAELNDFLRPEYRYTAFGVSFLDISPVKDRIESLGVPHTEVDLILVNGDPADFTYRVQNGDRVSVYPVFEAFDIAGLTRLRPEPLRVPRFVLDFISESWRPTCGCSASMRSTGTTTGTMN